MDNLLESRKLCEIATELETMVYRGKDFIICTDPSTDNNFILKVYRMNKNRKMDVARISMKDPVYINSEFDNYILSKLQLYEFINALTGPRESLPFRYNDNEYPFTVWDMLISENNYVYKIENIQKVIPKDLPIPNYTLLPTKD